MDTKDNTNSERLQIIEKGIRDHARNQAVMGRGRRASIKRSGNYPVLDGMEKAASGIRKSFSSLEALDKSFIAEAFVLARGFEIDRSRSNIEQNLSKHGKSALTDDEIAAMNWAGHVGYSSGYSGIKADEAADKAVDAGLATLGRTPSIQTMPEAPKEQNKNVEINTPPSSWPAGKYPSVPIEFGGTTVNVRGKAGPSFGPTVEAALAADIAALERASRWSMPGSAPKDNAERKVTSFREEAKIQDELLRGRPDAVKGPQLATTGDWSKYAIDALPEKPPAPPAPAPVPEKKSTAPSKPVPPEIQARRDAVEAGMRTWGFGGSVEGLKAAERQADAAAAQAKVDARRAEQEKEDANKRRAAVKIEHEEDRRRREEMLPQTASFQKVAGESLDHQRLAA